MAALTQTANNKAKTDLTVDNLRYLCDTIYAESGIVLDESKTYLLQARLQPIARDAGATDLNSLAEMVKVARQPGVKKKVIEAMTTHETLFFRDARPFEALQKEIFPALTAEDRPGKTIRVWSAACSSGQEPYSIAMIWKSLQLTGWQLRIFATDLSDKILAKAQEGRFLQIEVNRGLPAPMLVKNFRRDGSDWVINDELKQMIEWKKFNLLEPFDGFGPFDVIFCRNVLIYFDADTKKQILAGFRKTMRNNAYMLLGSSETTVNLDNSFSRERIGQAVVYRP